METKREGGNRGVSKAFVPLLRQKTANGTWGQALSHMLSDAPNVFCSVNSEPPLVFFLLDPACHI